jgi:predicted methyltransferase
MKSILLALVGVCISVGGTDAAGVKIPAYVTAAIADPARPAGDTKSDPNRKPAETVAFAGLRPGDRVVDLLPGKGYFTHIFAKVVGPKGWVYAYFPSDLDERYKKNNVQIPPPADPAFPNVSYLHEPVAKFLVPEKVDMVWTSQNYHDLHDKFFGPADVDAVNKAIFAALKPGGYYVVLDHAAERGSGLRDTDTLHRIDPDQVKREVLKAGFVFSGSTDILHNPADDHTKRVFDTAIRGETDQFIFKFRKPLKS